jgi:hypothetical protein
MFLQGQLSLTNLRPIEAAHFGTATNNVSKNSEFSTRSPLLTTSSKDLCDRFPLRISALRPVNRKGAWQLGGRARHGSRTFSSAVCWSSHLLRGCKIVCVASVVGRWMSFPDSVSSGSVYQFVTSPRADLRPPITATHILLTSPSGCACPLTLDSPWSAPPTPPRPSLPFPTSTVPLPVPTSHSPLVLLATRTRPPADHSRGYAARAPEDPIRGTGACRGTL